MKTPEEIKELLANHRNYTFSLQELLFDTLAYIQQLERERYAAIAELYGKCPYCINYIPNGFIKCFHLATCKHIGNGGTDDNWQWRGAREVE